MIHSLLVRADMISRSVESLVQKGTAFAVANYVNVRLFVAAR